MNMEMTPYEYIKKITSPGKPSALDLVINELSDSSLSLTTSREVQVKESKFLRHLADPEYHKHFDFLKDTSDASAKAKKEMKWLSSRLENIDEPWTVGDLKETAVLLFKLIENRVKTAKSELRSYEDGIVDCMFSSKPGEEEALESNLKNEKKRYKDLSIVVFEIYFDLNVIDALDRNGKPETDKIKLRASDERMTFCHPLVTKARETARSDYEGRTRKAPKGYKGDIAPYFNHVHRVAEILGEISGSPELLAAAYLHDHIEDLPKTWTFARMTKEFSSKVTKLVDWVTQSPKDASWEVRNENYRVKLAKAPVEALMLSAADKIANIEDLLGWMVKGYRVGDIIKFGWKVNSVKFHELGALFKGKIPEALYERYERTLKAFDELGHGVD